MKITKILLLFLFPFYTAYSQGTIIGSIETKDAKMINLFAADKSNKKGLDAGCDCMRGNSRVFYYDKAGKLEKIYEGKIKKITVNEGAVYCTQIVQKQTGGNTSAQVINIKLLGDMVLWGLPVRKSGKQTLLHKVLLQNEEYLLTMYTPDSGQRNVYIFTAKDHGYIGGSYGYPNIGYSKKGKKGYEKIKECFKGCTALIEDMEAIKEENKGAGLFGKKPLLSNLYKIRCKE